MRYRHLLPSLLASALLLAGRPSPAEDTQPAAAAKGSTLVESFESASLGKSVPYSVYLPPSYETKTDARFPVVVFLHGLFEDEKRWMLPRHGLEVLERLVAEKKISDLIVAVPSAGRGFGFYTNAKDGGEKWEDVIVKDFIPFLDAKYRTIPGRRGHAILGSSMGGYGALKIAFKRPDLFAAVAAHSPALLPFDLKHLPEYAENLINNPKGFLNGPIRKTFGEPIDEEFWRENNPLWIAEQGKAPKDLKIYFDCGENDRFGFQKGSQELHEILEKKGVPHESAILPGSHGWEYINENLNRSLEFLDKALRSSS